jgi:adenosylhomocysteine nucleosidase
VAELLFDDPCIVFALRREARAFSREFPPHQQFPGAPCRAWFQGPSWLTVLVLETGIGARRTEQALTWLLGKPVFENVPYRPKVVLSAGFAGALKDRLRVGDILLATEVADTEGRRWPTTWPAELPGGEWRPPLHRGRLLTASRPIGSAEEKQTLGRLHDCVAVDLESATVARLCGQGGVPFGCLRAISDDVHTSLSPRLLDLLAGGRVAPLRFLAALARSPRLAAECWRLARHTRLAARQLSTALGEVLTLTLPWTAEE